VTELVLLLVVGGVVVLLMLLARLHPLISAAIGLALVAVPVLQWITFDPRYFRSDGSAAGLVIFVVYAGVGVFCGVLGVVFLVQGVIAPMRARARPSILTGRQAAAAVLVTIVLLAGVAGYYWRGREWLAALERRDQQRESQGVRNVNVAASYALAWRSRGDASALELSVPAADLAVRERPLQIHETVDGPVVLPLRLALSGEPAAARLELWRDDFQVATTPAGRDLVLIDPRIGLKNDDRPRFWVKRNGGAWRFLGTDYTPHALAAQFPALFGLEQALFHTQQHRDRQECSVIFRYRGRIAHAVAGAPCAAVGKSLLATSVETLGRLAGESKRPAPLEARLSRARTVVELCEKGEALRRAELRRDPWQARELELGVEHVCGYAIDLGAAELAHAPLEAATVALRALSAHIDYVQSAHAGHTVAEILRALRAAGRGESREMLWAHAVRLARGSAASEAERKQQIAESFEIVARLGPALPLAADDPVFEHVNRAFREVPRERDNPGAKAHVAVLRAWDAKARATHAGSDLEARVRFWLCHSLPEVSAEHGALRLCADELLAMWEARAAARQSFDAFYNELELAALVVRTYVIAGHTSQDFTAVLPGLRRSVELAEQRFPAAEKDYDQFLAKLRSDEAQIVAKARSK
jgi:hypothetical protein